MIKMNAAQLRKVTGDRLQGAVKKNDIYIILDDVLDTYNIGGIFRLADAVGAKKGCALTINVVNHKCFCPIEQIW